MKLKELYTAVRDILKSASDSPGSEALFLLSEVMVKTRERLLMDFEDEVEQRQVETALFLARKRAEGYPLQYITKKCHFYNLELHICEGVFIPRIETEVLIDLAIETIHENDIKTVADIGTGTGCIAIAIALNTHSEVYATDVNEKALEVAKKNAEKYGVDITLLKGPYLEPLIPFLDKIELIVSNPPYVSTKAELPVDVRKEPSEALFAGEDGLEFFRNFFSDISLLKDKTIIMEFSPEQKDSIEKLCNAFGKITFFNDQFNKTRFFKLVVE
ncbi:peptide chain release factor N(5)-glutamine methyltransferase [Pseudothermotoga sp.]|uniref:peptide chain release factor N(5)-glutamine methyltransferase n=1 Tax=Pseudothermotoga sp. TaxID=2033661 RepID=UPI0031F68B3D